jgi:hypothetical protein
MVDLYRLPADFPRFDDARSETDPRKRVEMLEEAFRADVNHVRFVPYIQLHEFEALLFSDPDKLRLAFPDHEPALARLAEVVTQFASPEHIDDGATTSPSKRIIKEIPDYIGRKTSAAVPVLQEIGLKRVRECCGHFDGWMTKLESLGASPGD